MFIGKVAIKPQVSGPLKCSLTQFLYQRIKNIWGNIEVMLIKLATSSGVRIFSQNLVASGR